MFGVECTFEEQNNIDEVTIQRQEDDVALIDNDYGMTTSAQYYLTGGTAGSKT